MGNDSWYYTADPLYILIHCYNAVVFLGTYIHITTDDKNIRSGILCWFSLVVNPRNLHTTTTTNEAQDLL